MRENNSCIRDLYIARLRNCVSSHMKVPTGRIDREWVYRSIREEIIMYLS